MKLSALSLLIIFSVQFKIFGQIDIKSESEILAGIEWLSTNPVEQADKEFVSKSADYITYQFVKYPNFPVNFSALKEFMDTDRKYKYYDEINIVFTSNQLANKIRTENKYDLKDSSIKSMNKVLEYYKLLIEKEPDQRNNVLDKYSKMDKKELEKQIKKMLKK
ncbi:hypothetical protein [Bizionia myxarmorum]|uniref:Uncharacterized protein n=1 Tax=Bizionia myxarmorum TaxID=291186 RepID=A0A5D0R5Q1_9FLAO|nr:hypothetical protein [Bizionia myxarmorum]TYB76847.1 hypothetical protein ES674_09035 [Bizionia myxarmorum]